MPHLQHWSRFRSKTDITGSREWQWIKVFWNFFIGLQTLGKRPSRSTEEAMKVVALIFAYCNIVVNSYLSLCVLLLKYHNRKKPNPYVKLYSLTHSTIQTWRHFPVSYPHEKYTQCKALNHKLLEKVNIFCHNFSRWQFYQAYFVFIWAVVSAHSSGFALISICFIKIETNKFWISII